MLDGLAMEIPGLEIQARERERNILCMIHKLTYADGRAYRYLISDRNRKLCYVAKWTGQLLPAQTRLIEFFDPEENRVGRLQPPDVAPWMRAKDYLVYVGEEEEEEKEGEGEEPEPFAVIREHWKLVDVLLLRMPRYEVHLGEHHYLAEGSRYDTGHFYGIFPLEEEEESPEEVIEVPGFVLEIEAGEKAAGVEPEAEASESEGAEEEDWPADAEILEEIVEEEVEEAEPEREQVGLIECPSAGPSYVIETDSEPLLETPLLLASLAILIDMEQHS
ncbi:MAG: hypothetical protein AB8I69_02065 [Anaerolineae bacterium]